MNEKGIAGYSCPGPILRNIESISTSGVCLFIFRLRGRCSERTAKKINCVKPICAWVTMTFDRKSIHWWEIWWSVSGWMCSQSAFVSPWKSFSWSLDSEVTSNREDLAVRWQNWKDTDIEFIFKFLFNQSLREEFMIGPPDLRIVVHSERVIVIRSCFP
jgi:hypothetical protein